MHLPVLASAVALALSPLAAAQDLLGILNNVDTSFTSRGSATVPNSNPCTVFDRLDKETYAGWGVDPQNPGMRQIVGMQASLQDQIGNTPETFTFVVFREDPLGPNYPDVIAPLGSVGPLPTPANTSTAAIGWTLTANFATPILAPATADVFVGVDLPVPASNNWPTDGISCLAMYYVTVTSGISDLPGASHPTAPPEEVGNGGYHVPSQQTLVYTVTPRQWKIQPIVNGATGVAGTITNQTTAPSSSLAPGTSSQASGLYPDAQNPPFNAGRADDIASRWFRTTAPASTPVLFFLGRGGFGPEFPASALIPGSSGAICLDLTTASLLGLGFTSGGQAYSVISIPAPARSVVGGLRLVHQAVALNAVTGSVDAGPCTRQIL